jgi:ubiquinone/menaquinone biosynthesis C-methylase UbiE
MQEPAYRKDMSHLSWDEVYARQVQRGDLAGEWLDALRLKAGDCVLDIGAGPGFVSFLLAERVGPRGLVCAIDPKPEALAYLQRLQKERGVSNIKTSVADAANFELAGEAADAALISMVLHHTDDPAGIMRNIARLLKVGGRAVIAEFNPDGSCEHGPPRQERLTSQQIRSWGDAAGLVTLEERQQTPEHYMVLMQRA